MAQKTVTIRLALEDADKVRRALEDLGDKGKAAIDKIDGASTKRLRADFDDLKRAMDPVERSAYELQNRLALLDRALKQGAVSQAEYARVAAQARAQHEALAASFQKVETGTKLAAYQITNLGYQIQDVAVQLAGGQNPFLILIQQGPQAAGAVGGLGVLMRLMLSPTALAVGGLLAFGGAAALVVSRAVAVNRELRTLQTTLRAYGNEAGSAEGLRGLARNLTTSGLSRDDALSTVQEIARRRTLSVAQGAEIAGLASDIAAVTGQAVADAVKDIAGIIEGGYPAIRKLDEAFNFLTAEELRQIRAMAEHGDKAQALDVAIAALHRRFDGLREQAMGPAEQGLHRLSTAWNDLIEAVAVSEPVMKAVANLAGNMEALSKWVAGPTDADKGVELSHQIVSENKRLPPTPCAPWSGCGGTCRAE
jgi:phage-related minor tail protein